MEKPLLQRLARFAGESLLRLAAPAAEAGGVSRDAKTTGAELENLVQSRTAELMALNQELRNQIKERQRAEETQSRLVSILEATTDFVGITDTKGRMLYLNRAGREMVGLPSDPASPLPAISEFHPAWASEIVRLEGIPIAMIEGSWHGETVLRHRAGHEVPVSQVILSHKDKNGSVEFLSTVMRDMTERLDAEKNTRESLAEKEVLLKEIHHRVKNNLQVVSSLLQLQSAYIKDPQALEMFAESCARIQSMALIHERLYQSSDLAGIDFGEYVTSLVSMIFASYRPRDSRVEPLVAIENVQLHLDTAIPVGLIINELVTNSLKYAFAGRAAGQVRVAIDQVSTDRYRLIVSDNGLGLPKNFDFAQTSSLGLRLVRILVAQLRGTLEFSNGVGTEFRFTFVDQLHP